MQKLKTKRGITLIALIITIIVMLILVGVTVSISLDGGLFKTAQEAADKMKTAIQDESGAAYEYEIAKATGTYTGTKNKFLLEQKYGDAYKEEIAADPTVAKTPIEVFALEEQIMEAYNIDAEETGTRIRLGTKVSYSESSVTQTANLNSTAKLSKLNESGTASLETTADASDLEWAILGIEDGCLLLVATSTVGNGTYNGAPTFTLSGAADYRNNAGINKLNTFCKENYGNGEGAIDARSINVDDINKITGYDPTYTGNGKPCQEGTLYEYGNQVTFKLTTDGTKIGYESAAETCLDSSKLTTSPTTEFKGDVNGKNITTASDSIKVTNTYYNYEPNTLIQDVKEGETKGISTDSYIYKALFDNTKRGAGSYWLASPVVCTIGLETDDTSNAHRLPYAYWGLRTVHNSSGTDGHVATQGVYYTFDGDRTVKYNGVRPVVKISADALLTYDSTAESWKIEMSEQS